MKKNAMLKIAAILMVAVLLTTCAISSTFAKYVTSDSYSDTARVAKWGIELTVSQDKMFADNYSIDDTNYNTLTYAVKADKPVVAPGTVGAAALETTVTGNPEVAVQVVTKFDLKLENWTIDTDTPYCPLIITYDSVDYYVGKDGINNAADLEKAIEKAVLGAADVTEVTVEFDANEKVENLITVADLTWKWDFEKDTVPGQTDVNDTKLGNWEINGKTAPQITVEFSQTITQID